MILKSLVGASLLISVSLDTQTAPDPVAWLQMPAPQMDTVLLPLVRKATDCIIRKAGSDPRYSADMRSSDIHDLLMDSIAACGRLVRRMMEAHDRMYGRGSGEAFLVGPYLDVLPAAVIKVRLPR